MPAPAFAVARRCQQPVHRGGVGTGRSVGEKGLHGLGGGGQPGEIKTDAAQQRAPVGGRAGLEAVLAEPGTDQSIQRGEGGIRGFGGGRRRRGNGRGNRALEGPMRVLGSCRHHIFTRIGGAAGDPLPQGVDFPGRQRVALGRHAVQVLGSAEHAEQQQAFVGLSGHQDRPRGATLGGAGFQIEPQIGLDGFRPGAVAGEAFVGEQRPDPILKKLRLLRWHRRDQADVANPDGRQGRPELQTERADWLGLRGRRHAGRHPVSMGEG